jgi:hypothetical protein
MPVKPGTLSAELLLLNGTGRLTWHSGAHHTHATHRSAHRSRHATHRQCAGPAAAPHARSAAHAAHHAATAVETTTKAASHRIVETHVVVESVHVVALIVAVEATLVHATAPRPVEATSTPTETAVVVVALVIGAAFLETRARGRPVLAFLGSAIGGILWQRAERIGGRRRIDDTLPLLTGLAVTLVIEAVDPVLCGCCRLPGREFDVYLTMAFG